MAAHGAIPGLIPRRPAAQQGAWQSLRGHCGWARRSVLVLMAGSHCTRHAANNLHRTIFCLQAPLPVTTLPRPVTADPNVLRTHLEAVRGRVASAARRSGRLAEAVTLIGVVKTVAAERVCDAVRLGLADLGENRVQEAQAKISAIEGASEGRPLRWHMIGHLQRNKAARAARLFDRVHSVDGLEVAIALGRAAREAGRELAVMVEVNVSGSLSTVQMSS